MFGCFSEDQESKQNTNDKPLKGAFWTGKVTKMLFSDSSDILYVL